MAKQTITSLTAGEDIIIQQRVGGVNAPIYPVTKTTNVKDSTGVSVDAWITDLDSRNYVPELSQTKTPLTFLDDTGAFSTIQSASTTQQGVVQLTSATDSSSEALAATAKAVSDIYTAMGDYILSSTKGQANGVAPLDATGLIDAQYLPSYVDDVIEGYYNSADGKFYKEAAFTTEIPGESGKIYVDLGSAVGDVYRWGGTVFVKISDNSGAISDHIAARNNPHEVTKAQVGLGNVGNFLAVSTEANQGLTAEQQTNAKQNLGIEAFMNVAVGETAPSFNDGLWLQTVTVAEP